MAYTLVLLRHGESTWNLENRFTGWTDVGLSEKGVGEAGRAGRLRGKLLHYSYWTYDEYFRKYIRYTRWGAEELQDRGKKASTYGLLVRPVLRFLQLYLLRGGFLDGLPGLQVCMLTAFFNTFMKQARLWEMQQALPQPDPEAEVVGSMRESHHAEYVSPAA